MNEAQKKARLKEIRNEIEDYVITVNTKKRSEWLSNIEGQLKNLVVGQERAIEHIVRRLSIYYSGLKDPKRPIGSLFLMGPTGTGKTYTAKELAKILLGSDDEEAAVIIECANLTAPHSIQTLIGAPPSYIGYGDPPVLSQANIDRAHLKSIIKKYYGDEIDELIQMIRSASHASPEQAQEFIEDIIREKHRPISFIIFDEIEEAHRNIIRLLLNIFEEGKTTLADGSITDFSNSIITLTSNVGSEDIKKLYEKSLGFLLPHQAVKESTTLDDEIYTISKIALEKNPKFPSKFIGRVRGDIIVFRTLTRPQHFEILDLMLSEIQRRLSGKEEENPILSLNYSRPFMKFLIDEGIDPEYGVRNLRAVVEKHVSNEIGQAIGSGQLRMGDKVLFVMEKGKPTLKRKPRPKGIKLPEFRMKKNGKKVDLESEVLERLGLPPRPLPPPQPVGLPKRPVSPVDDPGHNPAA